MSYLRSQSPVCLVLPQYPPPLYLQVPGLPVQVAVRLQVQPLKPDVRFLLSRRPRIAGRKPEYLRQPDPAPQVRREDEVALLRHRDDRRVA